MANYSTQRKAKGGAQLVALQCAGVVRDIHILSPIRVEVLCAGDLASSFEYNCTNYQYFSNPRFFASNASVSVVISKLL
jgi:hypothetical protein